MQNVQNTDTLRVMNLVDLYRTKVGKESKIAKDAKKEYESMSDIGIWGESTHTEIWKKHLMVNEQLLGHFYAVVAGENAEKDVLDQLLPGFYDKTIFTEEEETFLASHFKELVNDIILTPYDDSLRWVHRIDEKDAYIITKEVLELIKSRVEIPVGSKVYYPNTMFAQLANLFDGCKYYCDTMFYAWTRVAVYANGINAVENANLTAYDVIMSYLPKGDDDSKTITCLCEAYKNLPIGGKLVLICPSDVLVDKGNTSYGVTLSPNPLKRKETYSANDILEEEKASADANAQFRQMLVEDKGIKEIIQLPQVMIETYCLLIAEKGRSESDAVLIDTRVASNDIDTKHYMLSFDNVKFNAILQNDGIDSNTGLRKVVKVPSEKLSPKILIPQVYVIERPSETEHPVPLSSLCSLTSAKVRDVSFDLPEDTPWITMSDLTPLFTGDMNMADIRKAGCPNNPPFIEGSKDYAFDKDGKFVDSIWNQMNTKKGNHVLEYRQCTFQDGNTDAVLYECLDKHGVQVAVVRATGKPYAVSKGILVFSPKNGIDANSLAALLRLPIVYRQLAAYEKYGIKAHLDDILAPTDKRIILDEKYRMQKELDVIGNLEEKLSNKEKSLRMRKHALTQSLSSVKAMFVALNTYRKRKGGHLNDEDVISRIHGTTVQDVFEFIHKGIFEMMPALEHIADVEYSFSKVETFDPEEFMEVYIAKEDKGWLNFRPVVTWEKGSNKAKKDFYKDDDGSLVRAKGQPLNRIKIPKDALEKIFKNIISNAKAYAFTDDTRKDYQLKFSWHTEGTSLIIEIENNGTPIPGDRDTNSLLEYGVSTALHHDGHNGIGCNEIDSIMRQYNGKVEIVSTPKELFTVKYVLTFNDSYIYLPN
ncbi:MAG: ATP-binding protein [Prevotella sp.]|nr:ATP-binding protein [Prevotella sp.]